jgi:hypothetical protein
LITCRRPGHFPRFAVESPSSGTSQYTHRAPPLLKPPCSCVFLFLCSNIAHLNLSVPNPVACCLPRGLSQQIPSLSTIYPVSAFPRCSAAFSRWFPNHRLFSFHKSYHFGFIPEPSILHITADCLVTRACRCPPLSRTQTGETDISGSPLSRNEQCFGWHNSRRRSNWLQRQGEVYAFAALFDHFPSFSITPTHCMK